MEAWLNAVMLVGMFCGYLLYMAYLVRTTLGKKRGADSDDIDTLDDEDGSRPQIFVQEEIEEIKDFKAPTRGFNAAKNIPLAQLDPLS
jgi:hypothetical protein